MFYTHEKQRTNASRRSEGERESKRKTRMHFTRTNQIVQVDDWLKEHSIDFIDG